MRQAKLYQTISSAAFCCMAIFGTQTYAEEFISEFRETAEFPSPAEFLQRVYLWVTGGAQFDLEASTLLLTTEAAEFQDNPLANKYCQDIITAFINTVDQIDLSSASLSTQNAAKLAAAENAAEKIAILRYVVEAAPAAEWTAALQTKNRSDTLAKTCSALIEKLKYRIKTAANIYQEMEIQDAVGYTKVAVPLEIASMLLGSTGQLNVHLIPMIQRHFLATPQLASWQQRLQFIFPIINASWQSVLDTITEPPAGSLALRVLQATFRLHPENNISILQTKQAILAAALTEYDPSETLSYRVQFHLWKEQKNPLVALKAYALAMQESEASYALPLPDATSDAALQNWVLDLNLQRLQAGCGCPLSN